LIISVTEREEFKRCRRRWDYSSNNRQGLQPITPGVSLSLGTLIHAALADWSTQCYSKADGGRCVGTPPDLVSIFMQHSNETVDVTKANYNKNVGVMPSDSELATLYESIELGMAMMKNYQDQWVWPFATGWSLYSTEQEYTIKVPGTDHYLKGKLDGVIVDAHSRLWIVEHKTYSMRPRPQVLENNNQFLAYLWLLTKWAAGEKIGGIAYDGMWKKAKPSKNEPLESLFCRMLLTRSDYELAEFARNLYFEVMDMAVDPSVYYNRRWEGCYDCPYESLCTAQSKGDDVDYALTHFVKRQEETNGDE
jgi:hypothetical protein